MDTPLPVFPSTNSIPPACFYNIQGLDGWLNTNPSYKQYFAGLLPYLIKPITSSLSSSGYKYENVPLCSDVTVLSFQQAQQYNQQLRLFQKVYSYNSNAYVDNYNNNGPGPIYYTFADYKELTNYKASVQLVNKLYPFDTMARASTLNWQIPFPIYM
jgi:hypothetical protein